MAEKQTSPEILPYRKTLKLTPAIGDWTTYHPPKVYAKRIKAGLYGFDRLSEERLNKALLIHYHFMREFLGLLQINLMLGAEFYAVSGEQTSYLTFLRSANYPLVHFKIVLPEWHSAISVCLDLSLANTLINQCLGSRDTSPLSRQLTDVENSILEIPLKEYFVPTLAKNFRGVLGSTELSALVSPDISTDTSLNPSHAYVYFNLEVALADNPPGRVQIGYSGNALKNMLKKMEEMPEARPFFLNKLPAELLSSISIPVSVSLGATEIGTGELQGMEVGDVVALDHSLETPVAIRIGEKIQLLGQPGKKGKGLCCRIIGLEKEGKIKVELVPSVEEKEEEKNAPPLEEEEKEEYPKEETEKPEEEILPEEEIAEEELEEEFPETEEALEDLEEEPYTEEELEEEEEEEET